MSDEEYYDSDTLKPISLRMLVRKKPAWAERQIRRGNEAIAKLERELERLRSGDKSDLTAVAFICAGIGGGTAVGWLDKDIENLPVGTKLYVQRCRGDEVIVQRCRGDEVILIECIDI
jgi:hypothetical protein